MNMEKIEDLFKKDILDELDIFVSSHDIKEEIFFDGLAQEGRIISKPENFEKNLNRLIEMCKFKGYKNE